MVERSNTAGSTAVALLFSTEATYVQLLPRLLFWWINTLSSLTGPQCGKRFEREWSDPSDRVAECRWPTWRTQWKIEKPPEEWKSWKRPKVVNLRHSSAADWSLPTSNIIPAVSFCAGDKAFTRGCRNTYQLELPLIVCVTFACCLLQVS